MSRPMLELVEVSKRYRGRQVLLPLSLEVRAGETLVLVGTSGSGKSTLLRMMNGLVQPDTGSVAFDGAPLAGDGARRSRHRMGYVTQDGGLFPHLRARDNVALLARHVGWAAPRIEARLRELEQLVRLPAGAIDAFPAQLSGGQRQRVSLMRALFLEPAVLLLDEPLGALDPITRAELQAELRALVERLGATTVLVTHDLAEAAYFGGTIVLLHEGAVAQRGPFAELVATPADDFVRRFIAAYRDAAAHFVAEAP